MNPIQSDILFKLLQSSNVRVWYYDTTTERICYVTADGKTEEAIPFDEHMAMKHPDDCAQVYESMEYMIKYRTPYPEQLLIRYRDHKQPDGYRYTLNSIVPIFEGSVIRVVGSEQDITPMVRKQQLAEQQTQLVGELMQRHQDDPYTIDRNTGMIHINRQEGALDISIDKLISTLDAEESATAIEALEDIRKGEPRMMEFHFKEKEPREDGNRHYIKCTTMPSKYDYRGNVMEYVGVGTDITREVADRRKLKLALAEAKEQSRKKSVFVARASHDLRNPLNVLLNLADMMCMDIPIEERREMGELMKQNGKALQALIDDILDLSHIENGIEYAKETVEVQPMLEDIITSFEISTAKSHNIILDADVQKPTVVSDRLRLAQIVRNYLSNAIKYSPAGSDIVVTLRNTDNELYIAVKDHGCGIADEDQQRVFDEFARFNTEVVGTGLGLSICKRIAEALGGTVGFESVLGEGSTFWGKI